MTDKKPKKSGTLNPVFGGIVTLDGNLSGEGRALCSTLPAARPKGTSSIIRRR